MTFDGRIDTLPLATGIQGDTLFEGVVGGVGGNSERVPAEVMVLYFQNAFTANAKLRGDVTNVAFAGGADPTGVLDSSDAFNAVVSFLAAKGGEMYIPTGVYRVDHNITFPGPPGNIGPLNQNGPMITVRGEGMYNSVIDATRNTSGTCFDMASEGGSNGGWYLRDFGLIGPKAEDAGQNSRGIHLSGSLALLQGLNIYGFNFGIWAYFLRQSVIYACHGREARTFNCYISGRRATEIGITVHNSLFQVANPASNSFSEAANLCIDGPSNVLVSGCLVDEVVNGGFGASSLLVLSGADIEIHSTRVYVPFGTGGGARYGIHIGDGSMSAAEVLPPARIRIRGARVDSFTTDVRIPTNTIKIDAGALDCVLEDITTDATNGGGVGGDISDSGTRTRWRDVNGVSKNEFYQIIGEQDVAYAANVTINPVLGDTVLVLAISGTLHFNAPTSPIRGQRLQIIMQQDGSGGHVVTWDAAFSRVAWSDSGNASTTISSIDFIYGGSGVWLQSGAQKPWA